MLKLSLMESVLNNCSKSHTLKHAVYYDLYTLTFDPPGCSSGTCEGQLASDDSCGWRWCQRCEHDTDGRRWGGRGWKGRHAGESRATLLLNQIGSASNVSSHFWAGQRKLTLPELTLKWPLTCSSVEAHLNWWLFRSTGNFLDQLQNARIQYMCMYTHDHAYWTPFWFPWYCHTGGQVLSLKICLVHSWEWHEHIVQ